MVGSPRRRWKHPQFQRPGVPDMSSPGSGPLAEMLTDGSMLTLPQLSETLTLKDPPPALQAPGAQALTSLLDSETLVHRQGRGPREGLVSGSEKTVFPSVSLVENSSFRSLIILIFNSEFEKYL